MVKPNHQRIESNKKEVYLKPLLGWDIALLNEKETVFLHYGYNKYFCIARQCN